MAEPETKPEAEAEAEAEPQPQPELEPDPISVRYEMNAQSRFFLCRFCGNHVVTMDNCIVGVEGTDLNGIICRNPVNVEHDDTMSRSFLNRLPAVNVRCNACNKYIGEKFVGLTPPCPRVMEGSYLLHMDRMLYWNGTQLRYAPGAYDDRTT